MLRAISPLTAFLAALAPFGAGARSLPSGPLILGYAEHCDANITARATEGVNVLLWSFGHFYDVPDAPLSQKGAAVGLDVQFKGDQLACIASLKETLYERFGEN